MSSPSSRERRQGAILDAAETLFLAQGYERTSLAEVVKRSGGSLATLYGLFGNKQGLLAAIATRWCEETAFKADEWRINPSLPKVEALKSYAHRQRNVMESPRAVALMRMLISESLRDREFALQMYRDFHLPAIQELSALFAGWTAANEAEVDDPDAAAKLFLDIIIGDSMLNTLAGVDDDWPDSAQIDWRLQPFFSHFKIR